MTINERVSDERLSTLANLQNHECMALPAGHNEVAMMARELQQYRAAAEKPIGSFHIIDQQVDGTTDYVKDGEWPIDNGELLVYAAPQVTSVPQAKTLELAGWQFKSVNGDWLGLIDEHGKNQAIREGCIVREVFAMTDGINDREQVRQEHAAWSESTFGNVGPIGPLKHLSKEALEAAAAPEDLSEWADMQFLLWDAQRRAGITDEQITQAMVEKLAVNKQREWPEPKDGEPRLHIAAPAVQAEQTKRLIGWRTADYTEETSDPEMAKNWAAVVGVLPVFEGDINTRLQAEQLSGNTEHVEPVSQPYTLREGLTAIRNLGPIDAEKIKAERDALNEPDVPDGYALVPIEPTLSMLTMLGFTGSFESMKQRYEAMLAAAPKQEAE